MKRIIKRVLSVLLYPVVSRIGYVRSENFKKTDFSKNSLLHIFFTNLKAVGFSPKHIVDVGANRGSWTRETLRYFPDAHFTLLEPQKWLQSFFQDLLDLNPKIVFYPVGAGSKPGLFKFTIVDRDDSCSFRYTEEEALKGGYKQVDIPIVTLNDLISSNNLPIPDIVKIDAEGLDIDVLKGAGHLFGQTEVFLVEAGVAVKELDNSFLNIILFMDENGYRLFEITDLNRPFSTQVLWLVELAFVKKNGIIDSFKVNHQL